MISCNFSTLKPILSIYRCYKIMLCQDKMAIKTCVQYYIVYICISICRYFISVLYQYVYFVIVLYIEGKHVTTIGNNVLLNTHYNVVKIHIFL